MYNFLVINILIRISIFSIIREFTFEKRYLLKLNYQGTVVNKLLLGEEEGTRIPWPFVKLLHGKTWTTMSNYPDSGYRCSKMKIHGGLIHCKDPILHRFR